MASRIDPKEAAGPVAAANEPPLPAEKPPAGGQVVKQENDTAQKEKERERELN